jgi:hypothetical protein
MIFAHCEKCHRLFINTAGEMAICDCGASCKTHCVKTVSVLSSDPESPEPVKRFWKQRDVLGVVRVESVLPGQS